MKKFGIALASILLAGSLAAFAGCGESSGNDTGKIDGNFKDEKDPGKATETLSGIDLSKAFGDRTSNDWALGLKVTEKLNVDLDLSVALSGIGGIVPAAAAPASQKIEGEVELATNALVNLTKTSILGQADVSLTGKEKGSSEEQSISAKAYLDDSYVYASVDGYGGLPMKVKVSLEDIMGKIGDIGGSGDKENDGTTVLEAAPSEDTDYTQYVQQTIGIIYQMGGKLSFDQNNGLKVKATFGDRFFANVLQMAAIGGGSEAQAIISGLSFTKNSSLEVAIAFDADGLFTEFGINVDLGLKLDQDKLGVIGGTVSVSGGMKIETSTEKVTLPAGLATDSSYAEVDLDEIFPGENVPEVIGSFVGEYEFYSLSTLDKEEGVVSYYVGDILEGTEYVFNENSYTLSVREDGTFTMTTELGEETGLSSMSGTWTENKDGTYTLKANDSYIEVSFEYGEVIIQIGDSAYLTFTK